MATNSKGYAPTLPAGTVFMKTEKAYMTVWNGHKKLWVWKKFNCEGSIFDLAEVIKIRRKNVYGFYLRTVDEVRFAGYFYKKGTEEAADLTKEEAVKLLQAIIDANKTTLTEVNLAKLTVFDGKSLGSVTA